MPERPARVPTRRTPEGERHAVNLPWTPEGGRGGLPKETSVETRPMRTAPRGGPRTHPEGATPKESSKRRVPRPPKEDPATSPGRVPEGKAPGWRTHPQIRSDPLESAALENPADSVQRHLRRGTPVGRVQETPPETSARGFPKESPGGELSAVPSVESSRRRNPEG
jgi:hypothetical protein